VLEHLTQLLNAKFFNLVGKQHRFLLPHRHPLSKKQVLLLHLHLSLFPSRLILPFQPPSSLHLALNTACLANSRGRPLDHLSAFWKRD
jgi:hypothetical protein